MHPHHKTTDIKVKTAILPQSVDVVMFGLVLLVVVSILVLIMSRIASGM